MPINLSSLSKTNILVIGDVMIDRYLWGEVSRISPEAPVPVLQVKEKSEVLGGAGNVAANLADLGCLISVIGVCGSDETGNKLKAILEKKGIEHFLQIDNSRPTITKTRVMAQGQQLIRIDEEEPQLLDSKTEKNLLSSFESKLPNIHVVIFSDYGKGLFQTPGISHRIISACKQNGVPVIVDPKGKDWERYQGATCITPNTKELELISEMPPGNEKDSLVASVKAVRKQYELEWLLVTRGSKGMCLIGPDEQPIFISAKAREVFDVSGAGDTVIASLAAGIALNLPFPKAAELSNLAAGIVVGKLGTQPITFGELNSAIYSNEYNGELSIGSKILTLDAAIIQVQAWRTAGEKIVFTNGCFDLLHPGHIDLLHQAKNLGDRLVIGLNTDESVKRLKGSNRPILSERDRGAVLGALGCVDMVVLFNDDTPMELIKAVKPTILVKGADYQLDEVIGRSFVESYGGRVSLVPLLEGHSTTGIANKVLSSR